MDKFEEMMQKMQKMSPAEKKAMLDSVKPRCTCMKCPTYNDCMKGKGDPLLCDRKKDRLFADKESLYLPDLPGDTHDGA